MEIVAAVVALLLGAAIGSFLNVVIYRVPAGQSLNGRSHCPTCDVQISAKDNIPVLSWLLLKGRCRNCSSPIAAQYPLVEAFTAVAFTAIVLVNGLTAFTLVLLYFAAISIALFMIDLRTLRLPDSIVLPSTIVVAVGLAASAATTDAWDAALRALIGAVALAGAYGLIWFLSGGRALGFGDVKLALILGAITAYVSWGVFGVGVGAGWVFGAAAAIVGLATGRMQRGKPVPFGPALLVGTWFSLLVGTPIANWYATLLHLN